ncbi:hypothetical protein HNR25_005167 [Streptomonospora salina]|uniref:Uncharacterized protein n=1 Tax=Streptomonospora salina TaxID=104205 RepID=A0A841EEB7_9ACTN|nr:hypothetical protein [Streptomonospora salina]MBB6001336.1 hypothetical protein [Streptomonospora salina]
MGEHTDDGPTPISDIFDQTYPLPEYSPEDRLKALIFYLRARAGAVEPELRRSAALLGTPTAVLEALLAGDMHTMRAELANEADGWGVLSSLLAYGGGLGAEYEVLAVALREFEEIAMDPLQRRRLPISTGMLERRGYQHSGEVATSGITAATDPRRAGTRQELLEALHCLHFRAGHPSMRAMETKASAIPEGADTDKHIPRSHNTLGKVHKSRERLPFLASFLAFVRGCGVAELAELAAWEDAYMRIEMPKQRARGRAIPDQSKGEGGWNSPTGPQSVR